ncbi:unnamed protein product [Mytilus coruscus]|uniref:Reverse transcriptase domain-containing protein n=1 Tax=Mytilus coruscus TaxID=42192 RepID=A0A6J8AJ10_MYTCO|nr:unnamed protein product [Mytilus coruscus]
MNKAGLCGDNWLLFKDWYKGLNSNIKWQGQMSRTFLESQGVRQGGVWSPTAYKIFINSLLTTLETYRIGSHIGSIYVGVPTVTDDVTLVSNCPYELQTICQKSCILNYICADSYDWSINGEPLDTPENAVHLGIQRDKLSRRGTKEVVPGRRQLARQTVYSLMGAGLYDQNGVNPKVSLHLIHCYVIPRLLYGLEVILLSKTDISYLTTYFVKLLKRIQHLPDRTANATVLLLIGQIPIEAEIHKRILEFGSIHPIWNTCGSEPYSTLRACIKSKLACNTYTLQCDKSKFSKRQVSAICPLCGTEEENRLDFVLRCFKLDNARNHFLQSLKTFIKDVVSTKLYDELFCC